MGGYLRDRPIWVKLGLIMIVPTIATVVVGFSALLTSIQSTGDASTAQSVSALTQQIGALTDTLQDERAAANTLLGDTAAAASARDGYVTHYQSLFAATDQAATTYRAQRSALAGVSGTLTSTLTTVDEALDGLKLLRTQAVDTKATKQQVVAGYTSLIEGLLRARQGGALLTTDRAVNEAMQTANALASYKEALALERIKVDDLLIAGESGDNSAVGDQMSAIYTAVVRQVYTLQVFNDLAGTDAEAYFKKTTLDGTTGQLATIEQDVLQSISRQVSSLNIDRAAWDGLVDSHLDKLRVAEKHFDDAVAVDAKALRQREQSRILVQAGLLLALVLIAVLIAWYVARSMNRSLRELRHGALAIAQYGLPQAVARLRDPSLNTALSPHQVAQQIADPLPVRTRDEFGQVTEAFNAVHLEAVRTAAEQAALRSSVATMFVNLARRSQILVDRLIGHLDRLERGEEDPDRLAELFQLDHLATRMRRNDENLLVLAGADSTRVQREPAALIDVLRAAQSEVEHYTRIEFGVIDRDIEIAAHAVNDLVHLVAELFDNATAFSPPDSTVVVEARRVGDRAVLYVEDHGIGMSPDQLADLNERLATPPMVDVAVSRMMGLVVVARLAVRHSVKVELRPAHERGTIADVLLPTAVLVPRALAGRGPMAGLPTGRDQQPTEPAGRAPLALESGPIGQPAPAAPLSAGSAPFDFGSPFDPAPPVTGAARNLPSWSDLTGSVSPGPAGRNGAPHNGGESHPPTNGAGPGLPQRRAGESEPTVTPVSGNAPGLGGAFPPAAGYDEGTGRPPVPRQTPTSPEVTETGSRSAAWMAAAEAIDADVLDQPSGPSAPPPPAWPPAPPVAPPAPVEDEPPALPVPERVVAALDITSEIPRVRGAEAEVPAGYASPTVPEEPVAAPIRVTQHADQTMELPIFAELESAWFRTSFDFEFGSAPRDTEAEPVAVAQQVAQQSAPPATQEAVANTAPAPAAQPVAASMPPSVVGAGSQRGGRPTGGDRGGLPSRTPLPERPAPDRAAAPESVWRTAADQGWRAAEAAAEPVVEFTTESGLPRRTPMAQLVPGGIEKPTAGVQKRSPEQVRGLLSAYHRGVQRGRSDGGAPDSGNPPHSGKEQE